MKKFLLYVFPVFLVTAIVVNLICNKPNSLNQEERIAQYQELSDYDNLAKEYTMLLSKDSVNEVLHFQFLINFFQRKGAIENPKGLEESHKIENKYREYSVSKNIKVSDVRHFGLAMIYYNSKFYEECLRELRAIEREDFKYLNFIHGAFYHYFDFEASLEYYDLEINFNPDNEKVYLRKGNLLVKNNRVEELLNFLNTPEAQTYVTTYDKRYAYFHAKKPYEYVKSLLGRIFDGLNLIGFFGAICILFIWVLYLVGIRSAKKGTIFYTIVAAFLGMLFAIGTSVLTDFNRFSLGHELTGDLFNDFLYCVFGIGAIEEVVKIIPFLLILMVNKNIKEPIDYIYFACICALGFAFVENLIYFDDSGIKTIQGRALTATVTHLFNSSLIAYGIVLGKFSHKRNVLLYFGLFFCLACICHGFYDFWIVSVAVNKFSFITFFWLLVSMNIWASIINNCINNSFGTQINWKYDPAKINDFLLYGLSFIFLLQYVLVGMSYGASVANYELQKDIGAGLFLLIFLTINLSRFDYIPHYWAPLKIWDWGLFFNIPKSNPEYFNYNKVIGKKITITNYGKNSILMNCFPTQGTVVSRELIGWEKDWFLIALDKPMSVGWKSYNYILVKSKFSEEQFLTKQHQVIQVRVVKNKSTLEAKLKKKRDFLFVDLARVEEVK